MKRERLRRGKVREELVLLKSKVCKESALRVEEKSVKRKSL